MKLRELYIKVKTKINKYHVPLFVIGYCLFFFSWFLDDVAIYSSGIEVLKKLFRATAYIFILLQVPFLNRNKKEWCVFSIAFIINIFIYLFTKEIYIFILTILLMISIDINSRVIIKVNYLLLLIGTISVLLGCGVGILENISTPRGIGGDSRVRNTFGFYHSNVLPLLYFYIICNYLLLKKGNVKKIIVVLLMAGSFVIYLLCNSRVTFIVCFFLLLSIFFYNGNKFNAFIENFLYRISQNIILFYSLLTVLLLLLLNSGSELIQNIDISILSGRLSYGIEKIHSLGVHLFIPIDFTTYANDSIIVDNAFLSVGIRYSLFFLAILCVLNYVGVKRIKEIYKDTHKCYIYIIIIAVGTVNFIDNDLISYSCYTFWLLVFNHYCNKDHGLYIAEREDVLKQKYKISVLMSTYNEKEEELIKSIESILNQTYRNLEFIIINDNPKNETLDNILSFYQRKDDRIRIYKNQKNLGLVSSLNIGLKHTTGEYVARMDADDIASEDRLEMQLNYMLANNFDFIGSFIEIIDDEGNNQNINMKFPITSKTISYLIRFGNCIPHPTWLLKRSVYISLNGYRKVPHCEDYDFILRAIKAGFKLSNLPLVKLKYRIRNSGISESNKQEQLLIRYYLAMHKNDIISINPSDISEFLSSIKAKKFYEYVAQKNILKDSIRNKHLICAIKSIFNMLCSPFLYLNIVERIIQSYENEYYLPEIEKKDEGKNICY